MKRDIFIPFLILLALTLGCSQLREMANTSTNSESSPNSNAESAKTSDSAKGEFAPSGDAKNDIEKMADRFLSLKSFRAEMRGDGETPMQADLEFVSPDRHRLKTDKGMETIVIGKTTYMKLGNSWRKMPMQLDTTITDMRNAFDKEGRKWFSDVKYVGEETADGKPAYLYAYHNKGPGAGVGENDSRVWIAKDDGLPIKIEAIYKSGNLKKMVIEYDFKTPITIEPPVK
ncbi:MAG: LolA family protein [Blastocatellia bacterium]